MTTVSLKIELPSYYVLKITSIKPKHIIKRVKLTGFPHIYFQRYMSGLSILNKDSLKYFQLN